MYVTSTSSPCLANNLVSTATKRGRKEPEIDEDDTVTFCGSGSGGAAGAAGTAPLVVAAGTGAAGAAGTAAWGAAGPGAQAAATRAPRASARTHRRRYRMVPPVCSARYPAGRAPRAPR